MLLSNSSIRTKFIIPPLVITVIICLFLVYFAQKLSNYFDTIDYFTANEIKLSQSLFSTVSSISYSHYDLLQYAKKESHHYRSFEIPMYKNDLAKNISKFSYLTNKIFKEKINIDLSKTALLKLGDYQKYTAAMLAKLEKGDSPTKGDIIAFETSYGTYQAYAKNLAARSGQQSQIRIQLFQQDLKNDFKISISLFAIAMLISFLTSVVLAQLLVNPISSLVSVVRSVTKSGKYDVRAPKNVGGEVGDLIDGINQMLFEIQRTDDIYQAELNLHRSAIHEMPYFYIITGIDGTIRFVSESVCESLRLPRTKIKGQSISRIAFHDSETNKEKLDVNIYKDERQIGIHLIFKYGKISHKISSAITPLRKHGARKAFAYLIVGHLPEDDQSL